MKRHEQAFLLMQKAAEDETLLDEVAASTRVSDEVIGFHFQQAAEKMLKALLARHGIPFRRTHNLRVLMDLLQDGGHPLPEELANVDEWTPYATLMRYEDVPTEIRLDRAAARGLLQGLRTYAEHQLALSEGER